MHAMAEYHVIGCCSHELVFDLFAWLLTLLEESVCVELLWLGEGLWIVRSVIFDHDEAASGKNCAVRQCDVPRDVAAHTACDSILAGSKVDVEAD